MDIGSLINTLTASLPNTLLAILGLVILWIVVSRLLRLAWKLISCGCVTIFVIALILIALHFLGK